MTPKPALKLVDQAEPTERTRVCDISFRRDDEHEARCLLAWKRREHPAWSQHAVSYRVAGLRKVLGR
jgi:hypothetical protein